MYPIKITIAYRRQSQLLSALKLIRSSPISLVENKTGITIDTSSIKHLQAARKTSCEIALQGMYQSSDKTLHHYFLGIIAFNLSRRQSINAHWLIDPCCNQKRMKNFKKMRLQRTKKVINKVGIIKVKRIFAAMSFKKVPV